MKTKNVSFDSIFSCTAKGKKSKHPPSNSGTKHDSRMLLVPNDLKRSLLLNNVHNIGLADHLHIKINPNFIVSLSGTNFGTISKFYTLQFAEIKSL